MKFSSMYFYGMMDKGIWELCGMSWENGSMSRNVMIGPIYRNVCYHDAIIVIIMFMVMFNEYLLYLLIIYYI